jgi:hypothetical protein
MQEELEIVDTECLESAGFVDTNGDISEDIRDTIKDKRMVDRPTTEKIARKEAASDVEKVARKDYNRLMKKYKEQQKMLNSLKMEEKMELREQFKHLAQTGRKRKYTPLRMKNRIIDYFATVRAKNKPPTKSGLMVHLKMHRDQFYAYSSYPEFKSIMEQTAQMMENWYEESLILNKYNNSGIQFALKNRFGWTDTQTVRVEDGVNAEDMLIRKIEALAPQLVGFFQKSNEDDERRQIAHDTAKIIEVSYEVSDEQYAERGNE